MDITTSICLGIASAVVNAIGFVPYIRSVLKGKTKPERSSWWIWSSLMIIAVAAQLAAGATWSVLFTVVFLIGNIIIAILSLRRGYGHFDARDGLSVLIALFGIAIWAITKNPLLALLITILVDFMGIWLTILKSWKAPYSENALSWTIMSFAAVLSILSVGKFDFVILLFPTYVLFANLCTVLVITYRRQWRSNRIKNGIKIKSVKRKNS